jgi:glycosyltransferase involved in cell wall biosynthesis
MKILVISSYLPYPLFSGGQVRLYNLIKELSGKHEITLVCEKRPFQTEKDIAEVKKICKEVITVERKKQWSLQNILKVAFSSHSFLVTGHTNAQFKKIIQETLTQDTFDLIHVETFYIMQNLPETKIPVVLVEHNIEYHVYERFMHKALFLLRPFLAIDIAKMRKEEENFWKKANGLVAVSREDQEVMKKCGCDPFLVSNGVNTEKFVFRNKQNTQTEKKILFLGDFAWIQNRDAATFIIREIWPLISAKLKEQNIKFDLKLWIVGRRIPDSIKSLTSDSDILFDEVSSAKPAQELFQEATLLLAPIRVGGGTSYKILESMSSGTPVVTMQMSADALGTKDEVDMMVGETADELAEKSIELVTNEKLYVTIAKNGRKLVEETYTWEEIASDLDGVYKEVVIK